jgi:hypothetical protein
MGLVIGDFADWTQRPGMEDHRHATSLLSIWPLEPTPYH